MATSGAPGRIVASCLLDGGGLIVLEEAGWRRLDDLACTGLAVHPSGDRIARVLWTSDDLQAHPR